MARTPRIYHRLPGRGVRSSFGIAATRTSLWTGPDHLLHLESRPGSESYRRFYYRDIEAILIRRTSHWAVWNAILATLMLVPGGCFAAIYFQEQEEGWLFAALVSAGVFLVLLLVNALRGPSCRTHIRTAVQIDELPSLSRLSVARKVLARIRPLIDEAQGTISPDHLAAADWTAAPIFPSGVAQQPPGYTSGGPKPLHHDSGKVHAALFLTVIFTGVFGALMLWQKSGAVNAISSVLSLATLLLMIFALRRQGHSDLPLAVKRITWGVLVYYIASTVAGMLLVFSYIFRHAGEEPPDALAGYMDEPGFTEIIMASSVLALSLGCSV
jgi:uncharacterized integral membrane protein